MYKFEGWKIASAIILAIILVSSACNPRSITTESLQSSLTTIEEAMAIATSECAQLDESSATLCLDVLQKRQEIYEANVDILKQCDGGQPESCAIVESMQSAITRTPEIVSNFDSEVSWVCGLAIGSPYCMQVQDLIAVTDAVMGAAIIDDLTEWTGSIQSSQRRNGIVDCGLGEVVEADIEVQPGEGGDPDWVLSENTMISILAWCAQELSASLAASGEISDFSDLATGDYSGISGFDPGGGYCGLGSIEGKDSTVDKLIGQMTAFHDSCRQAFVSNPRDAGQPSVYQSIGRNYDAMLDASKYNNMLHNATYEEVSSNPSPDGGTERYYKGEVRGPGGVTLFPEAFQVEDANGVPTWRAEYVNTPEGYFSYWSNEETGEFGWEMQGENGGFVRVTDHNDGSSTYEDSAGNIIEFDSDGNWKSWERNGEVICDGDCGAATADCMDPELCDTCNRAQAFTPKASLDCVISQGFSPQCQAFLEADDCCSQGTTGMIGPLVIPDENNAMLACYGGDKNSREDRCREQCTIADDIDCVSNCQESNTAIEAPSILDRACLYMMSDMCTTGAEVDFSFFELPMIGEGPQPNPIAELPIDQHFFIPPGMGE